MEEEDWTSYRMCTLVAVMEHLLPLAEGDTSLAKAAAQYVKQTLWVRGPLAQWPVVLAALDELDEWAGENRSFADTNSEERETLLRRLEEESNPYLAHAVGFLLQLGLEGFLGDPAHGGNPGGSGWTGLGLTNEGPRRRLHRADAVHQGEDDG